METQLLKKSSLVLILSLLFLFALHLHAAKINNTNNPSEPVPGAITDSIYCKNDKSQMYAVYIPTAYDSEKSWPIIYIFEPAARAKLPLNLYKDLAEKHGLLLACSYNSRNGPIKNNENAFLKMSEDINTWLNLDPKKQYVSGFSGGGRFSQLVAQKNSNISGVIAVAGPKGDGILFKTQTYITPYVGIVGNRDMNYLEHTRFQQTLNEMGVKNTLVTYNAAHQWPPKEIYDQAIQWHIALQDYNINKTQPEKLNAYMKLRIQYLDTTQAMSNVEKYKGYQAMQRNFNGLRNSIVEKKITALHSEKKFDKAIKQEEKILQKEEEDQIELVRALSEFRSYYFRPKFDPDSGQFSLQWWKREINQISGKIDTENAKGLSAARLIDFLRGQVHNQVQSARTFNNPNLVLSMHELNLYLYPNSIWFLWNQAVLCAQFSRKDEAISFLKKAKQSNEIVLRQIQQYPVFSGLNLKFNYLYE